MSRVFSKIVPQSPLELERFYLDTIEKLADTNSTLADEDKKSSVPIIGMLHEVNRKIDTVTRDNRTLRTHITRLEAKIADIERQL